MCESVCVGGCMVILSKALILLYIYTQYTDNRLMYNTCVMFMRIKPAELISYKEFKIRRKLND